jgi:hypothetical protein
MLRVVSDGRSLVADLNAARNGASAFRLQLRNDCFGFSNIGHLDFPFSPFAPTATGRWAKRRSTDGAETTTTTTVMPIRPGLMSASASALRRIADSHRERGSNMAGDSGITDVRTPGRPHAQGMQQQKR